MLGEGTLIFCTARDSAPSSPRGRMVVANVFDMVSSAFIRATGSSRTPEPIGRSRYTPLASGDSVTLLTPLAYRAEWHLDLNIHDTDGRSPLCHACRCTYYNFSLPLIEKNLVPIGALIKHGAGEDWLSTLICNAARGVRYCKATSSHNELITIWPVSPHNSRQTSSTSQLVTGAYSTVSRWGSNPDHPTFHISQLPVHLHVLRHVTAGKDAPRQAASFATDNFRLHGWTKRREKHSKVSSTYQEP